MVSSVFSAPFFRIKNPFLNEYFLFVIERPMQDPAYTGTPN